MTILNLTKKKIQEQEEEALLVETNRAKAAEKEAQEKAETNSKSDALSKINIEKEAREAADTSVAGTAKGEVKTEKEAREAAVSGLSGEAVKTSGNQTVAGVKTFSSSPVVPSATAGNQPARKEQLDAEETRAKAAEKEAEEKGQSKAEANAIPLTQKGANSGVATLDSSGKVPSAQIPAQPSNETYIISSEAAQLALTAKKGDRAIRTDTHKEYVNNGGTAKTMADWTEIPREGEVVSVNSKTGAVTLTNTDVGADASGAAASAESAAKAAAKSEVTLEQEAREAGVNTRLQKTENLKDVNNTGTSRANLKVPILTGAACVSTSNVTALEGLKTIDGYTLEAEDIVLLVGQTTESQNGPWVAASGAWTRPADFPTGAECKSRTIAVIKGTLYEGSQWVLRTAKFVTIGTTALVWIKLKTHFRENGAWIDPPTYGTVVETLDGPEITMAASAKKFLVRISYKTHKGEVKFSIQTGAKGLLTGFKELTATTSLQHVEPTAIELLSEEELQLVKETLTSTPQGLSVKFSIETVA